MNILDIQKIVVRIQADYPHFKLSDATAEIWLEELQEFTAQEVLDAVRAIAMEGNSRAPGVSDLKRRVKPKTKLQSKTNSVGWRDMLDSYLDEGYIIEGYDHPAGFAWSLVRRSWGHEVERSINGRVRTVRLVCG